ncbi:MAG: hypothetical protein ABI643_01575 [Candidatus Doudnabacteria bacterium]
MSVNVTTLETLKEYFAGVIRRANHHGPNIKAIVFPLIGYLVANVDVGSIRVRSHQGSMCNVLWCKLSGKPYAFSYAHADGGSIELRLNNLHGPVIARFTNSSSVDDFRRAFAK